MWGFQLKDFGLIEKVVMFNLLQDPTISINSLRKLLEDQGYPVSYHQLTQAFSFLYTSGILRQSKEIYDSVLPGNLRLQTEVEGRYYPKRLGLVRQDVVFYGFPSEDAIHRFFKICDLHPYTHYRTIYLDAGTNAYVQFDIPVEAKSLMERFYKTIQNELGLLSYSKIEDERMSLSKLDITSWVSPNHWDFRIFGANSLESAWNSLSGGTYYEIREMDSLMGKLDMLDLYLIRELTINGKVRPVDIAKFYERDASTISRRIKRLQKRVMASPVLQYDRKIFDVTVPLLITGDAHSADKINKFHLLLESDHFPFRAFMRSERSRFIQVAWLPPSIAGEYGYFLWKQFGDIKFSFLYLSEKYSWVYPFYNLNYDFENKQWKHDEDYLIHDPMTL